MQSKIRKRIRRREILDDGKWDNRTNSKNSTSLI